MKARKSFFLFSVVAAALLLSVSAFAQTTTFADANADYTFDLPQANWKMTVKPSATSPNVEYVYDERQNGHLEIRKQTLKSGALLADLIRDEEQKLQFLPGYVAGKEETFNGTFDGKIFNCLKPLGLVDHAFEKLSEGSGVGGERIPKISLDAIRGK